MRKRDIEIVKRSFFSTYKKSEWRLYENKSSLTFTKGSIKVNYDPKSKVLSVERDRELLIDTRTVHSDICKKDVGRATKLSLEMKPRKYKGFGCDYCLNSEVMLLNFIDKDGARDDRMSVSEILYCFLFENFRFASDYHIFKIVDITSHLEDADENIINKDITLRKAIEIAAAIEFRSSALIESER